MPLLSRRIYEYFLIEILISIVCAGICFGIFPNVETIGVKLATSLIALVLLVVFNARCLMMYRATIRGLGVYYRVNLLVVAIFAVVSCLIIILNIETFKTVFIFPFLILSSTNVTGEFESVLIVNGFMALITLIMPFLLPKR